MPNKCFEILPSNYLRYWIIGIHVVVWVMILFFPIDVFLKLFFIGMIGVSYFFNKSKKCIIKSFEYNKNNNWILYSDTGEKYSARLLKRNYISDFLLILRFEFTRPTLILFRKQLKEQDWRRLQMIVRH